MSGNGAYGAAKFGLRGLHQVLAEEVRGTGVRGLGGIPAHRPPNVYRPMLGVTRSETREIAVLAQLLEAGLPEGASPRKATRRLIPASL